MQQVVNLNRNPSIAICHSMGCNVFEYFLKWMEKTEPAWESWYARSPPRWRRITPLTTRARVCRVCGNAGCMRAGDRVEQHIWMHVVRSPAPLVLSPVARASCSLLGHLRSTAPAPISPQSVAAPLLGSAQTVKGMLSGMGFGLPIDTADARLMGISFSSNHWLAPHHIEMTPYVPCSGFCLGQSRVHPPAMPAPCRPLSGAFAKSCARAAKEKWEGKLATFSRWHPNTVTILLDDDDSSVNATFNVPDMSTGKLFGDVGKVDRSGPWPASECTRRAPIAHSTIGVGFCANPPDPG